MLSFTVAVSRKFDAQISLEYGIMVLIQSIIKAVDMARTTVEQIELTRLIKQSYRTGPDGLLTAVIELAFKDASGQGAKLAEQENAIAYLHGRNGVLFDHLDWMDWRQG
jgi:hypothetical protein